MIHKSCIYGVFLLYSQLNVRGDECPRHAICGKGFLIIRKRLFASLVVLSFILGIPAVAILYFLSELNSNEDISVADLLTMDQLHELGLGGTEVGQNVVIFFKPECRHCISLLASTVNLCLDLSIDTTRIKVVSISDSISTANFLTNYRLPFSVQNYNKRVIQQLGIKNVPTVLLIDSDGILRYKWVGRRSKEFIQEVMSEYLITGRIPIHILENNFHFLYSGDNTYLKFINSDTTLRRSFEELLSETSTVIEILKTKKVDGEYWIDHYVVYGNTCECEESDSNYLLISLFIDRQVDSLIEWYYIENVELNYVNNFLESQQELFYAYSN